MASRDRDLVLVGGGLVGSLLAVMLSQEGYRVRVFEKRPDLRVAKISAGRSINLALAERGIAALKTANVFDRVSKLLIPMRGRMLHHLDGHTEFLPYGWRPNEQIYSVSRGLLNHLLLEVAESSNRVEFHFEHECVAVDLGRQQLVLESPNDSSQINVSFDYVIGTDGASSIVREAIAHHHQSQWRVDWLDHDYKELNIPPDPVGRHQLEQTALHIWPRHGFMLIALPNLDGSFTVTLFLNKTGQPSFAELQTASDVDAFFRQNFPDALHLIPDLTNDFFENPTGNLGTVYCDKWQVPNRALLLGDAAHAIVPFHGQGMNAGFEDCRKLLMLLDEWDHDWEKAGTEFERRQKPQGDAIATMALENYVTMRDSVLDPDFQLKKNLGFELERRLPDRFIPRYSMVMFHSEIEYEQALHRGKIQDAITEEMIAGKKQFDEINLDRAVELVRQKLNPL